MSKANETKIPLGSGSQAAPEISPAKYVRLMKELRRQGNLPTNYLNWKNSVDNIYRNRFRHGGVKNYVTEKHLYLGYRSKMSPLAFVASRVYAARTR